MKKSKKRKKKGKKKGGKKKKRRKKKTIKHTRGSYKPAIFMDNGLSFDASSEVYGGVDLDRAVGSGKLKGGSGRVLGEGMKRQGHRESGTAGTLSLPRPIASGSNIAQPSAR